MLHVYFLNAFFELFAMLPLLTYLRGRFALRQTELRMARRLRHLVITLQ